MSSSGLIFVGIGLGVFASLCGTLGKQLLRLSELAHRAGNKYLSKVTLAAGLALNTAIGPVVDMLSYMFAPQSLIAPLGGLDVVWNTMMAPCTLGETPNCCVIFGAVCIAGGATCTSFFGNHEDKDYTTEVIQDTFIRPAVGIYLGILGLWVIFNVFLLQPRSANPKGEPWASGDPLRGLSLGLTAGSIAGNMFCVKGFIELVQSSIRDGDAGVWSHWLPYTLFLGAVLFATSNLIFLTKAMREYEALFMGAVFEGSLIFSACISGMIVFKDLESLEAFDIFMYFLALFGIVFGIGAVAWGCWKPDEEETAASEKNGVVPENAPKAADAVPHKMRTEAEDITASHGTKNSTNTPQTSISSTSSRLTFSSLTRTLSKRSNSLDCLQTPFPGHVAQSVDSFVAQARVSRGTPKANNSGILSAWPEEGLDAQP